MNERTSAMIRLRPMDESEFEDSLRRAIPRYAAELVERGLATLPTSLATSRLEFSELLPEGRRTAGRHFCLIVEEASGKRVGETWYTVREKGGKVHFWIDWIWIEPADRRRGLATAALDLLEREARKSGADRTGLSVWMDNPGAMALYAKLGFVPTMMRMTKVLGRTATP